MLLSRVGIIARKIVGNKVIVDCSGALSFKLHKLYYQPVCFFASKNKEEKGKGKGKEKGKGKGKEIEVPKEKKTKQQKIKERKAAKAVRLAAYRAANGIPEPQPTNLLLTKTFNTPNEPSDLPTIKREELLEMIQQRKRFTLVDLRTLKEIVLSGDPPITMSVSMPITPLSHLPPYRPPKQKGQKVVAKGKDKAKGGKGGKGGKAKKHQQGKNLPAPKEEPVQRYKLHVFS